MLMLLIMSNLMILFPVTTSAAAEPGN